MKFENKRLQRIWSIGIALGLSLGASWGTQARAESLTSLQSNAEVKEEVWAPETGWRAYAGVGLGYGLLAGSEFSESLRGGQYLFNGDIGYRVHRWVAEAG